MKLEYDEPLPVFAFKFNLRRYSKEVQAELKRLELQVKQRDNEINILVSMLQKGEGGGTKGSQKATAGGVIENMHSSDDETPHVD